MLHTIENDYLKVTVSDHGAELTSVYDKAQDFERIWCADPAVWNRHAPVLFPFVGKVKDGAYRYNGNTEKRRQQIKFQKLPEFAEIKLKKLEERFFLGRIFRNARTRLSIIV